MTWHALNLRHWLSHTPIAQVHQGTARCNNMADAFSGQVEPAVNTDTHDRLSSHAPGDISGEDSSWHDAALSVPPADLRRSTHGDASQVGSASSSTHDGVAAVHHGSGSVFETAGEAGALTGGDSEAAEHDPTKEIGRDAPKAFAVVLAIAYYAVWAAVALAIG